MLRSRTQHSQQTLPREGLSAPVPRYGRWLGLTFRRDAVILIDYDRFKSFLEQADRAIGDPSDN
jgi:hypothetical protein